MDKYNFSFIIPHYNSFNLLCRCLNSIPCRNDVQIIVVDDCSNDENIEQLQSLSRENLRILFCKHNLGAGHARNLGLSQAEGKWVLFADCDDFYEPGLKTFLEENINSSADCIYFSVNSAESETLVPGNRNFLYDEYISRYNPEIPSSEDWILFNKWEPWNKMISRRFIVENSLRYDEITKCNDMTFNIMVSFFAQRIKIVKDRLYCVTYCESSMTFRKTKPEEFRDCLLAFQKKNVVMHKLGHWHWHMPMLIQHRFFLRKEGLVTYIGLLKFYISNFFYVKREIASFKKYLSMRKKINKEFV